VKFPDASAVTVALFAPLSVTVALLPAEDVPPEMLQRGVVTEIVDPTPDAGIPMPPAVEAITFVTWTASDVFTVLEASWNAAVAKVPLLMTWAFTPHATHIVLPGLLEQEMLLFAATALVPAVTVTLVMSDG